MKGRFFIKTGTHLVPIRQIVSADYSRIEELRLVLTDKRGNSFEVEGPDALEAVMLMNPACLEGKRLRWARHRWALHNLVGHPLMQVLAFLGFPRLGVKIHDATVPKPGGSR